MNRIIKLTDSILSDLGYGDELQKPHIDLGYHLEPEENIDYKEDGSIYPVYKLDTGRYIPDFTTDLAQTTEDKLGLLSQKADNIKENKTLTVGGSNISTNRKARADITEGLTFMGRNPNAVKRVKTLDGWTNINKQANEAMQEAIATFLEGISTNEELHWNAIKAIEADTGKTEEQRIIDIAGYDITGGW